MSNFEVFDIDPEKALDKINEAIREKEERERAREMQQKVRADRLAKQKVQEEEEDAPQMAKEFTPNNFDND